MALSRPTVSIKGLFLLSILPFAGQSHEQDTTTRARETLRRWNCSSSREMVSINTTQDKREVRQSHNLSLEAIASERRAEPEWMRRPSGTVRLAEQVQVQNARSESATWTRANLFVFPRERERADANYQKSHLSDTFTSLSGGPVRSVPGRAALHCKPVSGPPTRVPVIKWASSP